MEDGLLSLKWNNHKTTFFEILKVLRDKANYTDATLAVEGNFYPVHKLVLSTCSEYFSEIFERTPCKSPVIVLKDVRSQDLESLLDYMYLGEVNVNQNDLALLLKTAECLRIKGLAVPDEDPTRHSTPSTPHHHHHHHKGHTLNAEDLARDTPPAKRRKEDSSSSATSAASPPRVSPSARGPSSSPSHSTPTATTTTTTSSADQPPNTKTSSTTNASSSPPHDHDAPMVKVEMEESEDGEDAFHDDNYEGAGEGEGRDFVEKAEHDPSTYPNTNFSMGSSQQQTGDLAWEDGENSFPQEAFGGDSSSQQAGGKCEAGPSSSSVPFVPLLQVTPMLVRPSGYRRHCPVCGKGFDQPYNLQRHIRTHTGERPFPCRFCAYAASERSHLKSHVARKHRQEYMNWSD